MRCWKYILKRKTPTIILTSIPVLFMLRLSMNVSAGIVITNESCVRSRFTPAPFLLPQKNHHPRCIPPRTALSECPTARRKYTLWQHPRGCRRCSSDGTAWDQCPDTANFPVARRYASIVAGSRSSCRKYTANRMISLSVISCFVRIAMLSLLFLSIIAGGERIGKSGSGQKKVPIFEPGNSGFKMGTSHLYLRIFFSIPQASLYSARQEHRKRCPCLFG